MSNKSFTAETLLKKEFKIYDLAEEWRKSLGSNVERRFMATIWGPSASGKTTYVLKLCKELLKFGTVYYNSLEQGFSGSLQNNVMVSGIQQSEHIERMRFGDRNSWEEMIEKIDTLYPKFVILDSIQYAYKFSNGKFSMGITKEDVFNLKSRYKKRDIAFIFISHELGNEPKGQAAKDIKYDSDIKIRIFKGVARSESRYGQTEPYYIFNQKPPAQQGRLF